MRVLFDSEFSRYANLDLRVFLCRDLLGTSRVFFILSVTYLLAREAPGRRLSEEGGNVTSSGLARAPLKIYVLLNYGILVFLSLQG